MNSNFLILILKKIQLFLLERQSERGLPPVGSCSKWLQLSKLSWPETGNQDLLLGLACEFKSLGSWALSCCLPRPVAWGSIGSGDPGNWTGAHMWCWHHRQRPNVLCYGAGTKFQPFFFPEDLLARQSYRETKRRESNIFYLKWSQLLGLGWAEAMKQKLHPDIPHAW